MSGETETTIAALRDAASAMRAVTASKGDEIRSIDRAIDALLAAKCERLAAMDESKEHEAEGASSIATWARRELHQDATTTRQMVRAGRTFRDLPAVAEAARAGAISFEHVTSFTYALKQVGIEKTQLLEEPLLEVAKCVSPPEFHAKVRQVRDMTHPDDLDAAWLKGMDKRDIRLARTTEGWHLTGFLDIETGAKLNAILTNVSVPRDAQDDRAPSTRRMDALDRICTAVLEHGLPADNGVRPHINVTVEADTLKAMAEQEAGKTLAMEPATVAGFGSIGPALLAHLLCGAELTPFLITRFKKNVDVLDVGRTQRLATPRQAKAIALSQHGMCASPACHHPIAHNHHVVPWSRGGPTDLDNLIGLCRKCHSLVHAGRLELARGSPVARAA
ncbi:DUF222 domain-containing protein [Aeromicrobium sp.]|uniref:HNH endonuclease n=1 Tax=Aeromicrobium sp. TaxID=1871063 RepID=UPI003C333178